MVEMLVHVIDILVVVLDVVHMVAGAARGGR